MGFKTQHIWQCDAKGCKVSCTSEGPEKIPEGWSILRLRIGYPEGAEKPIIDAATLCPSHTSIVKKNVQGALIQNEKGDRK